MLGVRRLLESHTAEYLANEIRGILECFEVPLSKIVSVCTDGGANIKAAVRVLLGPGKHVYCLAHLLSLVVNDGLEDQKNDELRATLTEVKNIVKYSRQSNICMDLLRAEQVKDGVPEGDVRLPIQSVVTRWNSSFYMTQRFVELFPYLARAFASTGLKKAPRMLSSDEIEFLREVNSILQPFEVATKEISGSGYFTGSLVLPVISLIQSALNKLTPVHDATKQLHAKLMTSLKTRSSDLLKNPLLCMSTSCDPRFRKMYVHDSYNCIPSYPAAK